MTLGVVPELPGAINNGNANSEDVDGRAPLSCGSERVPSGSETTDHHIRGKKSET